MSPAPAVVVVPSIAVDALVERCVAECHRVAPGVEVVVLVDDATAADRLAGTATVVETGPVSIAAKRNQAVAAANTEFVAFIDSDAYPADGWLDRAVELLRADPMLAVVGGPNVSPPDEPPSERYVGRAHRSFLVDGWWTFRKVPGSAARDVDNLPSCNMVVRRSTYLDLGGMDESLFTGEDVDLCARLTAAGYRMHFTPDVMVFHKNRSTWSFVVQRFTFGVAMVPLWRRGERLTSGYSAVSLALALFTVYLASGPLGLWSRRWGWWWRRVVGAYAVLVLAEAVRHAASPSEVPGVAWALAVGNLAPGAGVVGKALGLVPDLRGVYRNDR